MSCNANVPGENSDRFLHQAKSIGCWEREDYISQSKSFNKSGHHEPIYTETIDGLSKMYTYSFVFIYTCACVCNNHIKRGYQFKNGVMKGVGEKLSGRS